MPTGADRGGGPIDRVRADLDQLRRQRQRQTLIFGAVFLVALALSIDFTRFLPDRLAAGLPRIGSYLYDTLPTLDPAVLFADSKAEGSLAYWYFNLPKYLQLLFETVNMALLGTLLGFGGGFLLCFPASRNVAPGRWIAVAARRITELQRAVPEIVYALLFVWAFGIGPLAGITAIAIHTSGALAKLFSEVVENASLRPVEGVRAAGGSWFDEMRYGILPQVLPNFLSYALLRFEINIRSSAIIGFVGAGGIGQELYYVISFNFYEEVSAILLLVVLTVMAVDHLSDRLRQGAIGKESLA
ncbi:phosphonate ABC transporter, permease protein PhnE [Marinimicrococcus flavescens]|uniref:Phosphonate ABC transporter, permease protein PhnE n=1 Tax=Marinimicrococcus flavescens TaxID=3031815 RepID=A0AAP3UZP6_9PROT|nr:phosphonate ABC transporter, permease protein PhnE [Marinimicrococcus flavescens]